VTATAGITRVILPIDIVLPTPFLRPFVDPTADDRSITQHGSSNRLGSSKNSRKAVRKPVWIDYVPAIKEIHTQEENP
jgi:hypothetical protein